MKIKRFRQVVKYFSLLTLAVLLFATVAGAQKSRRKKRPPHSADKQFSVPCAKVLRIGLAEVLKLHTADITRRNYGDEGDSDTDLLEQKNALENYLPCRRADTANKLKKLPPDERGFIAQDAGQARRIAIMRVDLLYGVQFDERYVDPVDYAISLNALALVEDYKGELAWLYLQTKDFNQVGNAEDAEHDLEKIGELLKRIEKISLENKKTVEFTAFKAEIEKTLTNIADEIGTEKRVTTAFLVRLLKLKLPAEN